MRRTAFRRSDILKMVSIKSNLKEMDTDIYTPEFISFFAGIEGRKTDPEG